MRDAFYFPTGFQELTGGRSITLYRQHEVVTHLNAARAQAGGKIIWEAQAVEMDGIETYRATVRSSSSSWNENW